MNALRIAVVFLAFALAGAAHAQTPQRVRGTITAYDGKVLSVKSRDGRDLTLQMAENATVAAAKAITLADLKAGDYVGVMTQKDAGGRLVAREVHTIARTVAEGFGPWDYEPGAFMTNASVVTTVKSAAGTELTVEFKGGSQTIRVPEGTPIVTTVPADRSLLVPGAYLFIAAQADAAGKLTALRIQAEKDGVRPPQ